MAVLYSKFYFHAHLRTQILSTSIALAMDKRRSLPLPNIDTKSQFNVSICPTYNSEEATFDFWLIELS